MDLLNGYCSECREEIALLMLRAATTEFYGAQYEHKATYCPASDDHEHRFVFRAALQEGGDGR